MKSLLVKDTINLVNKKSYAKFEEFGSLSKIDFELNEEDIGL